MVAKRCARQGAATPACFQATRRNGVVAVVEAVVTDSSACLPVGARRGVVVLPLTVHLPHADLPDDADDAGRRVYAALRAGETVTTSPPQTVDYLLACERPGVDATVIITPAAEFTVMHANAELAAQLADRPVSVVDSRTAAPAQGLVVRAVSQAVEHGASLTAAVHAARHAARRAELVATLDNLLPLTGSGRGGLGPFPQLWAAPPDPPPARTPPADRRPARPPPDRPAGQGTNKTLVALPTASTRHRSPQNANPEVGVRPVFSLRSGTITPLPPAHGTGLRELVGAWRHGGGPDADLSVVFHASCRGRAEQLAARLDGPSDIVPFSPAMGAHTGAGVLGVAWLRP